MKIYKKRKLIEIKSVYGTLISAELIFFERIKLQLFIDVVEVMEFRNFRIIVTNTVNDGHIKGFIINRK